MAYHYEETEKNNLIAKIRKLAKKLDVVVYIDDMEYMAYADLIQLKADLTDKSNEINFDNESSLAVEEINL